MAFVTGTPVNETVRALLESEQNWTEKKLHGRDRWYTQSLNTYCYSLIRRSKVKTRPKRPPTLIPSPGDLDELF